MAYVISDSCVSCGTCEPECLAQMLAPWALSPRAILSMRSTLLPASSAEPALVFALPDLSPRVDSDTDQKVCLRRQKTSTHVLVFYFCFLLCENEANLLLLHPHYSSGRFFGFRSRFPNLVYSGSQASLTVPTAPFLCLAIFISDTFFSSVSG